MEKKYLSAKEAREFTGFSDRTLYAKRVAKEIDFIRIGKSIRYPLDSLQAYFEKNRVRSTSEALVGVAN